MPCANSLRRPTGHVAGGLLVIVGGFLVLTALQRQLIYFPETAPEEPLLRIAAANGLEGWRDADGELIGWSTRATGNETRRAVVFHGNAGHALYRKYFSDGFLSQGGDWQVYLFEYPGYGARPGTPSEDNINTAATEAVEALLAEISAPLYLVGESLGSGVASHLAGSMPTQIAGLLLVTPFTSLTDVAAGHFSFLPVRTLLRERYDAKKALRHYGGPVAFLIAGSDEIVPAELGRELHDSYRGPKWLHEQAGAGHNTLDFDPAAAWWKEAAAFLVNHTKLSL
jgi:pimeloyl-ACP methyl ester carboxylesterase